MIIPIVIPPNSGLNPTLPQNLAKISHNEYILIELQGALEVKCNCPSERDGQLVGTLKIDDALRKPTLLIGHHLLEGKVVTLAKPIAVLRRSSSNVPDPDIPVDQNMMECDVQLDRTSATTWNIVAIAKKKILFSKRPMPVVGRQ